MNEDKRLSYQSFSQLRLLCAVSAIVMMCQPALAQSDGSGISTHQKTPPSAPPAAAAPAPAPAPAAQPAAPAAPAPAPQAAPAQPPAQDPNVATAPQPNPLGAGWNAKFGVTPPANSAFRNTPEQVAIVQKINAYFNAMNNLEGSFVQTDADDKRKKGRFFIERPGKLRFDYSLPSKQKIISDGKYLAIEDHDLNTTDRYPLDSTPFRLLLSKDVDLLRDARIISLDGGQDVVVITLEDKASDGAGQIRLFLEWPNIKLREWMISDPQGLNTRIQVADVELNKAVKPELFRFTPELGMPKFNQ